jgi:uncharacterized delta-60 repeat protein
MAFSLMVLGRIADIAPWGGVYYMTTLGGSASDKATSVAIDSANNSYMIGRSDYAALLVKFDAQGTIQWQRSFDAAGTENAESVAIDSSDNVYTMGYTNSQGLGNWEVWIAKYNSSGTIQWQRSLGGTGLDIGSTIAIDSSDNVYVSGHIRSTGANNDDLFFAKYNSSGTIQWQRVLGGAGNDFGKSIAIDSSDNVYLLGYTGSTGAGSYDFLLAKYNSSGTIQWQRVLGGSLFEEGYSVAIDSSDNVYVLGYTGSTGQGSADFLLAKYNSSGTIQWQRTLGGSQDDAGYSVAIDSSNNVYVIGYTGSAGAGVKDLLLAKYDSAGTIQWQRTLGGTGGDYGYGIAIDSSDNVYVSGSTDSTGAGDDDFLLAKLPNDGSLTGVYSLGGINMTYAPSTLTGATSTLTDASASLTSATSTLTDATSTLTDASASLTQSFKGIGA